MMVNDSLMMVMQEVQKTAMLSFMKGFLFYLIAPIAAVVIGGIVLQYIVNKKSIRDLITGLKDQIEKKADFKETNDSIRRTHSERKKGDIELSQRIDTQAAVLTTVESNVSYIRGKIDTFLQLNGD